MHLTLRVGQVGVEQLLTGGGVEPGPSIPVEEVDCGLNDDYRLSKLFGDCYQLDRPNQRLISAFGWQLDLPDVVPQLAAVLMAKIAPAIDYR